jgi:hypothetical protein
VRVAVFEKKFQRPWLHSGQIVTIIITTTAAAVTTACSLIVRAHHGVRFARSSLERVREEADGDGNKDNNKDRANGHEK